MNRQQWTNPVSQAEASRRAAGRRRYNAYRRSQMWRRRFALARVFCVVKELPHGWQQRMARRFGVHKSVIARDMVWVREWCSEWIGSGIAPKIRFRRNRLVSIVWEWP